MIECFCISFANCHCGDQVRCRNELPKHPSSDERANPALGGSQAQSGASIGDNSDDVAKKAERIIIVHDGDSCDGVERNRPFMRYRTEDLH